MGADSYTIELDLSGQNCLVLGGGSVALRKLKKLFTAGARLEVISLDFSAEMREFLDSSRIKYSCRSYQKEDLQDKFLVITATSDHKLNSRVGRQAREAGILVNVVDSPELSNFNSLATFTSGLLKIAVSTSGASPALAASIKNRLAREFGSDYAGYLKFLDKLRPLVIAEMPEEKRRNLLRKLGDAEMEELLEKGKLEEALKAARSIIPSRLLQQYSGTLVLEEGEFMNKLVIGTRASKLALAQADTVKKSLEDLDSYLQIEIRKITTKGDRILNKPLAEIEGKGLFLKEIEKYLLEGSIDLAVHSLKDVPVDLPRGLKLAGYPAREDPRDVLVATGCTYLRDLPPGAVVGTGSLRRKAQLLQRRSDLKILPVRGNVNTRLDKLKKGEFQALILAAAGLRRLELESCISSYFSPLDFLPAAGQGALAVEIRQRDRRIEELIASLEDEDTAIQVRAERALLSDLGGGCHVPIGCHARIKADKLELSAMVAAPDGREYYRQRLQGPKEKYREIARELADKLLEAGAEELLGEDYNYE